METIKLSQNVVNEILAQAQQSPQAEICGLISRGAEGVWRCYPVPNCAEQPAQRYCMEPAGQIDALRQMREAGESLFAIYHSHPHSAAQPSATDIREARYPEALYLIISLDTAGVLELSAWRILTGGGVVAVTLELS